MGPRRAGATALAGKYVFGDFVSGRLRALELPERIERARQPSALGKWPILPSTFGVDEGGELYVADFGTGTIFRFEP